MHAVCKIYRHCLSVGMNILGLIVVTVLLNSVQFHFLFIVFHLVVNCHFITY